MDQRQEQCMEQLISLGSDDLPAEIPKSPALADGQLLEGTWELQFWTHRDRRKFVNLGLILSGIKSSFKKNNLKKYIKSRNYFQFNISNTLNTSLAGGITIRTGCQFPDLLCKLHLELDPLLTLHGNVTSSHFLQVEDKGEKLPVLKLLSVSENVWEKTCLLRFFICLQHLPSLEPIYTFNHQDFSFKNSARRNSCTCKSIGV